MADRVDYDYELGNGWKDPFQKLILQGMREIRDRQEATAADIQDIKLKAALAAQAAQATKDELAKLNAREDDHDDAIADLQSFKDRAMGVMAFMTIVLVPVVVPVLVSLLGGAI